MADALNEMGVSIISLSRFNFCKRLDDEVLPVALPGNAGKSCDLIGIGFVLLAVLFLFDALFVAGVLAGVLNNNVLAFTVDAEFGGLNGSLLDTLLPPKAGKFSLVRARPLVDGRIFNASVGRIFTDAPPNDGNSCSFRASITLRCKYVVDDIGGGESGALEFDAPAS